MSHQILLEVCGWLLKEPFLVKSSKLHLLALLAFLGQQDSLDVWQDTTLSNGHTRQKFVQLLIVTDGELEMSWDDPGLLVVSGSISCQLKNLSSQVFHDCSQVDWGTSSYSLGIVALSQVPVDPAHWELQTSTAATALCLSLSFSSLTTSRHVDLIF